MGKFAFKEIDSKAAPDLESFLKNTGMPAICPKCKGRLMPCYLHQSHVDCDFHCMECGRYWRLAWEKDLDN